MSKSFKKIKGQTPMEYQRDKLSRIRIVRRPRTAPKTGTHNYTAKRRAPAQQPDTEPKT